MIYHCPQGSDEWRAIRLGKVTASRVSDVIAKIKSGPSASRANYRAELICERLTGVAAEGYTNAAMLWGVEHEPEARAAYEWREEVSVQQIGFADHPTVEMSGCSPDGIVGVPGIVEIKCPNTATHIETLLGAPTPEKYIVQIQWQIATLEKEWCDFVSWDPRLPEEMRYFRKRIMRDNKMIATLEDEVRTFLFDLDAAIRRLKAIEA